MLQPGTEVLVPTTFDQKVYTEGVIVYGMETVFPTNPKYLIKLRQQDEQYRTYNGLVVQYESDIQVCHGVGV